MKTLVVIERGDCWRLEVWEGRPLGRCLYEGSADQMLRQAADCVQSFTRAGVPVDPEIVILPRTASDWCAPADTWRQKHPHGRYEGISPTTELTAIGEQFVIPGCERRETARGRRPTQSSLWDVAE